MEDNIDVEMLIKGVQTFPEIWDKNDELYKDRYKKREAWECVCAQLNSDFAQLDDRDREEMVKVITRKWNNIRDQWTKWQRKDRLQRFGNSSGSGPTRKYIYHKQLKFLKTSNYPTPGATCPSISDGGDELTDECESSQHAEFIEKQSPSGSQRIPHQSEPSRMDHQTYRAANKRQRVYDEFEERILGVVENGRPSESRHLMFFRGIIPSLVSFNENQTVDFQIGVLQLVKNIQNGLPPVPSVYTAQGLIHGEYEYDPSNQYPRSAGIPSKRYEKQTALVNSERNSASEKQATTDQTLYTDDSDS